MAAATDITEAIRKSRSAGRPAMVAYLVAGYPNLDDFIDNLKSVCAEADVVEIGVPFTDPMADGMTIQRASHAAIENGVSLRWILDELAGMEERPETPLVLMSYLNPLLAFGFESLAERALEAGVSGFIVPDLPYEESDDFRHALDEAGLALIQLVSPVTPADRLPALCKASRGFVYAVTTTGITGGGKALPDEVISYLEEVRAAATLPVCAGFGIRSPEQVQWLAAHSDGVVVGSALVEVLESGSSPAEFLRSLRS